MRLVFPLLLLLLGILFVGFLINNPEQRVTITIWNTPYPDVSLGLVALVAMTLGVTFTGVVALVEGATIRLANRRLRNAIQRLETENRFLRSQQAPPGRALDEPLETIEERQPPPARVASDSLPPADAPVYEPEGEAEEEEEEEEEAGLP
jgi:hypothetical protein